MKINLAKSNISLRPSIQHYCGHFSKMDNFSLIESLSGSEIIQGEKNSKWQLEWKGEEFSDGVYDFRLKYTLLKGNVECAALTFNAEFESWSKKNYVSFPGAVYAGNRFDAIKCPYPPFFWDEDDHKVDLEPTITLVPRLQKRSSPSGIYQNTGDLSTPAVGVQQEGESRGFWLLTDQQNALGNQGLYLVESYDRKTATCTLASPCVREYRHAYSAETPTNETGKSWSEGESLELHFRIYLFDAPKIQNLYDRFFDIRKDLAPDSTVKNELSFSEATRLINKNYNENNWRESHGYYAHCESDEGRWDFQLGWTGGGMGTLGFLIDGDERSRERAKQTLDKCFDATAKSGFMKGVLGKEGWGCDSFIGEVHPKNAVLLRKNADALTLFIKQFTLLRSRGEEIPKKWLDGTRKLADAFVTLWERYGQFGQFVDVESGNIIVGGTASAVMACGGLALASEFFAEEKYLETAKKSAEFYYQNYVKKGYTNGGPGEILQSPDSESAFAMLDSFATLFELTRDELWLTRAEEQAKQASSWVVSYDYNFPKNSTFGKLQMSTLGTVIANAQNKHSAPGACTLSCDSLMKIYRASGNRKYLELVRDISHALTQYVSREDRPISMLKPGWICERVNMSDWEYGSIDVGEVFNGTCWPEVSIQLSYSELPGIYVRKDTGDVEALDNVEVSEIKAENGKISFKIANPTQFKAVVKVLVENGEKAKLENYGMFELQNYQKVVIEPRASMVFSA